MANAANILGRARGAFEVAEARRIECNENAAALIDYAMDWHGCSQRKLAEKLGCTHVHLSFIRHGHHSMTLGMACKIALLCDIQN